MIAQTPPALPLQSKNYNGIDLVKLLCSLMVITIHIRPFHPDLFPWAGTMNILFQQCLCRIAVPFYFTATGFLLFKPSYFSAPSHKARDQCFKLLRLFGLWTVLLFTGPTDQLWYLKSSAVAIVLLALCFRLKLSFRHTAVLAGVLYSIGLLGEGYDFLLAPVKEVPVLSHIYQFYFTYFDTTRNGLFFGLPFMVLGAVLANTKIKLPMPAAVLGFCLSMLMLIAEVYILRHFLNVEACNLYISLIPALFFLMYIALHWELPDRPVYKKIRAIGILAFFSHYFINRLITIFFLSLQSNYGIELFSFRYFISIPLIYGVSALIEYLSRKPKLRWLRYLYS